MKQQTYSSTYDIMESSSLFHELSDKEHSIENRISSKYNDISVSIRFKGVFSKSGEPKYYENTEILQSMIDYLCDNENELIKKIHHSIRTTTFTQDGVEITLEDDWDKHYSFQIDIESEKLYRTGFEAIRMES